MYVIVKSLYFRYINSDSAVAGQVGQQEDMVRLSGQPHNQVNQSSKIFRFDAIIVATGVSGNAQIRPTTMNIIININLPSMISTLEEVLRSSSWRFRRDFPKNPYSTGQP